MEEDAFESPHQRNPLIKSTQPFLDKKEELGMSLSVVGHERGTISYYRGTDLRIPSGAGHRRANGGHLFRS